jgi:hypothetical protein
MLSSIIDLSASGNRQWSSVAKIPPPRSGRRRPGGNPCVTPGAARLADRRPRILERLTTRLTVAHIASRAPKGSAPNAHVGTSPRFWRSTRPPVSSPSRRFARISEAMIVARTMEGDLAAMNRDHGRLDSAVTASRGLRWRPPRKPRRPGASTRSPRRWRGTKRWLKPRGNFSCLQILEKPQNGIGISGSFGSLSYCASSLASPYIFTTWPISAQLGGRRKPVVE